MVDRQSLDSCSCPLWPLGVENRLHRARDIRDGEDRSSARTKTDLVSRRPRFTCCG